MPKQTLPRWVSPHVLRSQDRVYQRYSPWNTGVVSKIVKGHSFTVVYDYPERKPGKPRQRFTYHIDQQSAFLIGKPPESMLPAPVNVEGNEEAHEKDD